MKRALFLGIDVGTTGVKALLVDGDGKAVDQETVEYPLSSPRPLWAEQDPEDWWQASVKALRSLSGRRPLKGTLLSIGLTGQMHGSVFLDPRGKVIRPAILWCDQRTGKEVKEIEELVGKTRIREITGNPVFTGFTAPKILWLRRHEPAAYRKITKILLPKDYLRYRLTGELASEVTDNSGTSLFDVGARKWSSEILAKLAIDSRWLAPVFESPEIAGRITDEAAGLTGLPPGLPVAAGAGDQAASGCGNGVVSKGVVSATIGTSGVLFAFADKVLKDPEGRIHTMCHAVPGKWHLMSVHLSSGGSLRWFRDNFCAKDSYDVMTAAAAKIPAGSEGLFFLPYLTGERTPHADPLARAVFFGATGRHTRPHFTRAVLEGAAFSLRDGLEIMEDLGLPVRQARISGGGARSDLWCRIFSDVFGKELVRTENPDTTALGAAILAAVGAGFFGSVPEACGRMVRTRESFRPDRKTAGVYNRAYQIFRRLYPAAAPLFDSIAAIKV